MSDVPEYDPRQVFEGIVDSESLQDPLLIDPKKARKELKVSRLVIVETVYHKPYDDSPRGIERRYSSDLSSDEQPYERRLKIENRWQPLDFGWIETPGVIVVHHILGKRQTNPTEEERQADKDRRLLLCFSLEGHSLAAMSPWPMITLPPGEDTRFRLGPHVVLLAKAKPDSLRINLNVYPE